MLTLVLDPSTAPELPICSPQLLPIGHAAYVRPESDGGESDESDAEVTCPRRGDVLRRSDFEFSPTPESEVIKIGSDEAVVRGGLGAQETRVSTFRRYGNDASVMRWAQIVFDGVLAHECGDRPQEST